MKDECITALLEPKSIAIIGASATPGKIGYTVLKNLRESCFDGAVYPINPTAEEILGWKAYPSVKDVPGPIDAAVVTIPALSVLAVVDDLGKAGVKVMSVITSGFGECGQEQLERDVVARANGYGMRVLGPNIVGVLSNSGKMNASFSPKLPLPGKASLVSQSGALLISIDMASYTRNIGFDKLISNGNMADIDFADTIDWLDQDPNTQCISLYIEGFKDGRRFIESARRASKPIIALKAGVSAHGAAAAASHTGSLAGAVKIYGAAFQQAGVIQAADLNDLFNRTLALSLQPALLSDNLLVITNGGGVGVLATDAAEKHGVPLNFAPADLQAEMRKHMPPYGSAKNPIDMTGMANIEWYYETVKTALTHPWVGGVVVLYCETAITNPHEIAKSIKKAVDEAGVKDKPVTISFVGGDRSDDAMRWLIDMGIPAYEAPDLALNAMGTLREFSRFKNRLEEAPDFCEPFQREKALEVIAGARRDGRDSLTEVEAKQVFAAYGLPVTHTTLAVTEQAAVDMAVKIGFPVVMKIVSPDILHKSDAGGVKVNIKDEAGVRDAYAAILKNSKAYKPDADIHGIAVQEMAPWGTEVILGSINDPTFGPTMMFGLGGIFVEVLKDVTFRVAPVASSQALNMLSEIRGAPILAGARGEAPRDRKALADVICKYSAMIMDLAGEIAETDANPVLVYEDGRGVRVVDARVILKKKSA